MGTLSTSQIWSIAAYNIERFSAIIASRPNYKPDKDDTLRSRKPACEWGCAVCHMECAIAPDRLAWWQAELAKTCGSSQMGRA